MYLVGVFGTGLMLCLLLSACVARAEAPRAYWGVYMEGVPWDMERLKHLEERLDKKVSMVHWGQPWWHCYSVCGYQRFTVMQAQFDAVRAHGAIPLLDWASWDYATRPITGQPEFALRTILRGEHDAYIRQWAADAKAWGHPFFLRFNWEMNGNWFPWSEQVNGNARGEYVRAWRHVHDIFQEVGATNVTWVWCPAALYDDDLPFEPFYPGDAYVDWVGTDIFNWAARRDLPWSSFQALFTPTYNALVELAPDKPIMIAEIASIENPAPSKLALTKARWIQDSFSETTLNAYPQLGALVWFHWNDNDPDLTWVLDSSPEALDAFAESIAPDAFAENLFADIEHTPISALHVQPRASQPQSR